jgi:hypothetical protein
VNLQTVTLAERPDLADAVWAFPSAWAPFMYEDPTANLYYTDAVEAYPEFVMLGLDGDEVVARSFSVPFTWDGDPGELPEGGWDWVIRRAVYDRLAGRTGNLVSALEITIQVERRGTGLAALMLGAMRRNVARLGFTDLVAPVRPNGKPNHPDEPMSVYCGRTRPDGLPEDPWLRVHVRAGGRITRIATTSMTIPGTLSQWREWTGLAFDEPGPVYVPGGLVPVICAPDQDTATYVEPNVWVHHKV